MPSALTKKKWLLKQLRRRRPPTRPTPSPAVDREAHTKPGQGKPKEEEEEEEVDFRQHDKERRKWDLKTSSYGAKWQLMLIGVLAVALLWATSLKTAVMLTSKFIQVPDSTIAFEICASSMYAFKQQSDRFESCATRQMAQCRADLFKVAAAEKARADAAHDYNEGALNAAQALYSACSSVHDSIHATVQGWVKLSVNNELTYLNATCTPSNLTHTQQLLGTSAVSTKQMYSQATAYSQRSVQRTARLASFIAATQKYNQAYLANKTVSMRTKSVNNVQGQVAICIQHITDPIPDVWKQINIALACLSPFDDTLCNQKFSVKKAVNALLYIYQKTIGALQDALRGVQVALTACCDAINGAADLINEFVAGFNSVVQSIRKVAKRFGVHLKNFGLPQDPCGVWLPNCPNLGDMSNLLNAAFGDINIERSLYSLLVAKVTGLYSPLLDSLNQWAKDWGDALVAAIYGVNITPDDYNPPQYRDANGNVADPSSEVVGANQRATAFQAQQAAGLQSISQSSSAQAQASATNIKKVNLTFASNTLSDVTGDFKMQYEELSLPGLNIMGALDALNGISSIAVSGDYVYRLYRSFRTLKKFYDSTELGLPVVDMCTYSRATKIVEKGVMKPVSILTSLLSTTLIPKLVFGLVGLSISVAIAAAYTLTYKDYRLGCVKNTAANGTFFTQVAYASAYNFAARQGTQVITTGMKKFAEVRGKNCSDWGPTSQDNQFTAAQFITDISAAHYNLTLQSDVLRDCVNVTYSDYRLKMGCCNQTTPTLASPWYPGADTYYYPTCASLGLKTNVNASCPYDTGSLPHQPYPPLNFSLHAKSCKLNGTDEYQRYPWVIQDEVFHCGVLPGCTQTCPGPNEDLMMVWTRHCSCSVQWLFHSTVFSTIYSVMIFVALNSARKWLLSGIIIMRWRKMHNGDVTYRAPCDMHGNQHIVPKTIVELEMCKAKERAEKKSWFVSKRRTSFKQGALEEFEYNMFQYEVMLRRAKARKTFQAYEKKGRKKVINAIGIIVLGYLLLSLAPRSMKYNP